MKNIHLLKTDKPSRLQLFEGINEFEFELCSKDSFFNKGVHIYITSDEEIKQKELCYCISNNCIVRFSDFGDNQKNYKKIILTTDQKLIADGIQVIDDEFLEWFVKNPSCEEVKVELQIKSVHLPQKQLSENSYDLSFRWMDITYYKIIIPKEEPKQELMYSEEEVYNITQQLRLKLKSGVLKWQDDFEFDLEKWFEQFKKK
jgi:hypothetical protein